LERPYQQYSGAILRRFFLNEKFFCLSDQVPGGRALEHVQISSSGTTFERVNILGAITIYYIVVRLNV